LPKTPRVSGRQTLQGTKTCGFVPFSPHMSLKTDGTSRGCDPLIIPKDRRLFFLCIEALFCSSTNVNKKLINFSQKVLIYMAVCV